MVLAVRTIRAKRMCLGTFSRRGAVASATIYLCAECASLRSAFLFHRTQFPMKQKKETGIAHCAAGLRFIFCIIFPHLQSSGPLPESVPLP